jgi:hypothetical protein
LFSFSFSFYRFFPSVNVMCLFFLKKKKRKEDKKRKRVKICDAAPATSGCKKMVVGVWV